MKMRSLSKSHANFTGTFLPLYNSYTTNPSSPEANAISPSDKESMVLFSHNAGPAVQQASVGFDTLFKSTRVEGTVPALAGIDAWKASVTELFVGKESRGRRRQKDYTDAFAKLPRTAINQLKA